MLLKQRLNVLDKVNDRFGSILLKKSIMVSTAEKYVLEIEIFALSTGLQAQISISDAYFSDAQTMADFFNTIDQMQTFAVGSLHPERGTFHQESNLIFAQ
ncbi:hypothetical protein PMI30_04954 [Pseudomonas sp. GM50]|nr:hypothetical protein [Pseudomonas sp. GM50]EJM62024.1 hypothetical protein PMI30_04954 [Pseudomonas sp. GM50]